MRCPQCGGRSRQAAQQKLTTGKRYTRHCHACDVRWLTIDQGNGERFVRYIAQPVDPLAAGLYTRICRVMAGAGYKTDSQRRAFDAALKNARLRLGLRVGSAGGFIND